MSLVILILGKGPYLWVSRGEEGMEGRTVAVFVTSCFFENKDNLKRV